MERTPRRGACDTSNVTTILPPNAGGDKSVWEFSHEAETNERCLPVSTAWTVAKRDNTNQPRILQAMSKATDADSVEWNTSVELQLLCQ